ncbi:MAG: hypothetical protein II839_02285, partial [Kiritimatiellae bacterium]|nr:hypothetical protein [Kiritimatiellia bacterium]
MRIYELAQKLNTTSAALLRRASELELEITTAISSVPADDEAALRTGLMPPTIEEVSKRRETREAKAAEAARLAREAVEADAAALDFRLRLGSPAIDAAQPL